MDEWTIEALREHFKVLRETDREAITTALASIDARLLVMNEFRQTIDDQQDTFARKEQVTLQIAALRTQLDKMEIAVAAYRARAAALNVVWGVVVILATLGIAIWAIVAK